MYFVVHYLSCKNNSNKPTIFLYLSERTTATLNVDYKTPFTSLQDTYQQLEEFKNLNWLFLPPIDIDLFVGY